MEHILNGREKLETKWIAYWSKPQKEDKEKTE